MSIGKLKAKSQGVESVLGIDASTNSLAFCLYGKNGPEKWGEIKFNGSSAFERLSDGQRKTRALRQELSYDMIVFESAVYVQNKRTVILLAYAFGAIISVLMLKKTKTEEISPFEWQGAIGNKQLNKEQKQAIKDAHPDQKETWYKAKYREARKQYTKDWVKSQFGIDVDSDNVSDAIAIAHVGYDKFAS